MALSEGDKAICRDLAATVADEIISRVIIAHIESCPHGKSLLISKWMLVGVLLGSGIASGGVAALVVKILMKV